MKKMILLIVVLLCGCNMPKLAIQSKEKHPTIYYEVDTNSYYTKHTQDTIITCRKCHPQFKRLQYKDDGVYLIFFNIETVMPE